ncbi:Capsular polysaccharide synthesis protein [Fibrobacter sp. UWH5]|uniref:capsular polysaccharide synthesis protein n=1 Tax=Fibrobacter sp. UWH5 TaxID=1896211 RepID=UPI00091386BB|nr:capsular polysaccharide synthesis protein [Fibrobacter sp. UWH5]SHL04666.1 Capsular polysaccharide synthesis protein [Fibrobacter sp. UWH5]
MKKLKFLLKKAGGIDFFKQQWRSHTLLFTLFVIPFLGFKKKSLEISRQAINNLRLQKIRRWCKKDVFRYRQNELIGKEQTSSNKVWILWLQGIDSAPVVVRRCYESMKKNLRDREIVLLTEANYREYVTFPDYIQKKIDNGVITRTHFSDLLRLELLEHYGGTWIDATVYCSGSNYPDYLFDSNLFVYQCLKPGLDGECYSISSWFMTACTNHPIICLTKHLLYEYWKKRNSMIDYFLIHDFFEIALETYPEEWKKVIPFCNSVPHMLLLRLFDTYDSTMWQAIKGQTCFHKLTYKFDDAIIELPDTFYSNIFR